MQIQTSSFTAPTIAASLNPVACAGICEGSLTKVYKSDKGSACFHNL